MYPHRIRLRGPWKWETVAVREEHSATVKLPCDAFILDHLRHFTKTRFSRRFHWPVQLQATERLWLVARAIPNSTLAIINGQTIQLSEPLERTFESDITGFAKAVNDLELLVSGADLPSDEFGDVALEVRCQAFLRNVQCQISQTGCISVSGLVIGHSDQPLDLYVIVSGTTSLHVNVSPSPAGTPVHFECQRPDHPRGDDGNSIQMDLIHGPSIWHRVVVGEPD